MLGRIDWERLDVKRTSVALALGSVCTVLAPVVAQAQQLRPLGAWVQQQFHAVGSSCVPGFPNNERIVPSDIRSWALLSSRWATNVRVYDSQSLDSIFSVVYLNVPGQNRRQAAYRIGVAGQQTIPILYQIQDNAVRKHNCATMLSASATANLNISIGNIRSALTANSTQTTSQTAYAYAGRMISPLAVGLGLNPTAPDSRGPVPPFRAAVAVWDWYRASPELIPPGERGELQILTEIDGAAFYRTTGLTQDVLLSGSANISAAIPFLAARGSAAATGSGQIENAYQEFSVAQWGEGTSHTLPSPAEIARRAAALARFVPSERNITGIEDSDPFTYTLTLTDLPSAYCRQDYWTIPARTTDTTSYLATQTGVSVNLRGTSGEPGQCDFTFQFVPATTATATVGIAPAIRSLIGNPETNSVRELVLTADPIRLTDYRASLAAAQASGPSQLIVASDQPPNTRNAISLTFEISEKNNRRASGVVTGSTRMTLRCDRGVERQIVFPSGSVRFGRTEGLPSLALDVGIPAEAIPTSGTIARCVLDGRSTLTTEGNAPPLEVDLPTHPIGIWMSTPAVPTDPAI